MILSECHRRWVLLSTLNHIYGTKPVMEYKTFATYSRSWRMPLQWGKQCKYLLFGRMLLSMYHYHHRLVYWMKWHSYKAYGNMSYTVMTPLYITPIPYLTQARHWFGRKISPPYFAPFWSLLCEHTKPTLSYLVDWHVTSVLLDGRHEGHLSSKKSGPNNNQ